MKKRLQEFQVDDELKKQQLFFTIKNRLKEGGIEERNDKNISTFINIHYDLLRNSVDTMPLDILANNYKDFLDQFVLSESIISKILKENKI